MATNVEITKGGKDNNANLIKKFTRKVQESGIIPRMKGLRYAERNLSTYVKKTKRLKSIKNREVREEQIKLGKISVSTRRGR
jgi:ribosomal protein S21